MRIHDCFRWTQQRGWSLVAAGSLLAVALVSSGYVVSIRTEGNQIRPAWTLNEPIRFQIWEGFTDSLPNIVDGSRPDLAIREALERWVRVSSLTAVLTGTTATQDVGNDNQSVITIADTPSNRDIIGDLAGVCVAQMLIFASQNRAELYEADILLRPQATWSTVETDDFETYDILQVIAHEFGHAWNLKHTIDRGAVMFPSSGPDFSWGFSPLSWDDIAGVNVTYPLPGMNRINGSISGKVTRNGSPVFGAFVVAVDESGTLSANAITLQDGSYRISLVPPGRYTLYVEPLDGPATTEDIGDGIFSLPMVSDFLPRFYQDSAAPNVTVSAGAEVSGRDFQVEQGNSAVDAAYFGIMQGNNQVRTSPLAVKQGETISLIVAGEGLDEVVRPGGLFLAGSAVTAGEQTHTGTLTDGTPVGVFPLTVTAEAPTEPYAVFLRNSSQLAVATGMIEVYSPWRFLEAFAQFANLSSAKSALFLVNTDLDSPAAGSLGTRDGTGTKVTLGIGNLSNGPDGQLAFNLNAGGALLAASQGTDFVGSLRGRSNRRVGGTVLFETPFGTTGVGPGRPLQFFIAPIEVSGGGSQANTGIAITNLDPRPATVFARAQNESGAPVPGTDRVFELPGNGQLARFILDGPNSLIPGIPGDFKGTLVVTANRKIAATVIRTAPGVFTTFPVVENRSSLGSYFAQFVNAPGLTSRLVLVNPSPMLAATAEIVVRNSQGAPSSIILNGQTVSNGRKTVTVMPLGRVDLETSGAGTLVGSVEVSSQAGRGNEVPVGGVVLFGSDTVGTTGVGESYPTTKMVLPLNRNLEGGIDTGIALVNGDSRSLTVSLEVRNQDGAVVKTKTLNLGQGAQLARFPDEAPLELGLDRNFTGSLWIQAPGQLAATVIRQAPGVLTTFPVITLEEYLEAAE